MLYKKQLLEKVLKPIELAGGKAYFVGGCVRDYLIGKVPHDFDICTDLQPADLRKVFSKFSNVSKNSEQFGVTMPLIQINGKLEEIEIATFRKDETKGRHPKVSLDATIEEDAARRDFTINALYEDVRGEIYDPTGLGLQDIRENKLRFVGSPKERLEEDPLRAFRFVRFMAQKGFDSAHEESEIAEAVAHLDFSGVSKERMLKEFKQIIAGDFFTYKTPAFDMAFTSRVFEVVGLADVFRKMDEVEQAFRWHAEGGVFEKDGKKFIVDRRDIDLSGCTPIQHGTVLMHTFLTFEAMKEIISKQKGFEDEFCHIAVPFEDEETKFLLSLGALLHDIGKAHCGHQGTRTKSFIWEGKEIEEECPVVFEHPQTGIEPAAAFCKALRMSNEETHVICSIVAHHMEAHSLGEHKSLTEILDFVAHPHFKEIMCVGLADERGAVKLEGFDERGSIKDNLQQPLVQKALAIFEKGMPEPILKGSDLIAKGRKPGPLFKKMLDTARKIQIDQGITDKDELFKMVKNVKLNKEGK